MVRCVVMTTRNLESAPQRVTTRDATLGVSMDATMEKVVSANICLMEDNATAIANSQK